MSAYSHLGTRKPMTKAIGGTGNRARIHPALGGLPARSASTGASRWIVRSIMLATTGFALLDLFLLMSVGHH